MFQSRQHRLVTTRVKQICDRTWKDHLIINCLMQVTNIWPIMKNPITQEKNPVSILTQGNQTLKLISQ